MDSLLSGNLILFGTDTPQEKEQKESFSSIWIKDGDMRNPANRKRYEK